MWWLCQPVISVSGWSQLGQLPPCSFHRYASVLRPSKDGGIFTPWRCSRYDSHSGSYGLHAPWIFTWRLMGTEDALNSVFSVDFPPGSFAVPEKDQDRLPTLFK